MTNQRDVSIKMSNKTRKKVVIGILLFMAFALLTGLTRFYSSADVEGRIIDSDTGRPIAGAVVVGIWQLESQGFEHVYGDAIHVVESVSDAEGRYRLKGFYLKWVGLHGGQLWNSDPDISVWAEGYKPGKARRDPTLERGAGFRRVSPLNGRDIKLKREVLDNKSTAKTWGRGIRMLVDDAGCAITQLSALKVLMEQLEPQYSRYLMEAYGRSSTYYHDMVTRCRGDGKP